MLAPGLLLFAPSGMVVFSPTRVPAIAAAPRPRATIALQAADGDEALGLAYRTLGIAEDATYDEITEAHIELSERYVGDSPRLAALDDAMERVVNEIMRRRLRGEMRPKVADSPWDERPVQREMPWVPILIFLRKLISPPGFDYAKKVLPTMLFLAFVPWVAPRAAATAGLITYMCGFGFIYNRDKEDVPRDEFGQIGEIRPYETQPLYLTCALMVGVHFASKALAKRLVARLVGAPDGLESILKASLVPLGLTFCALFTRVSKPFA